MNPCGFLLGKLLHGKRSFQIAYILSCYGGWAVIFSLVYPLISASTAVPSYHKTIGYGVLALCLLSWRLAVTSPGNITSISLATYDNYAYDGILYQDHNNLCPTLSIRKLARSKYDRYTQTHVPRFDHHCLFLNQSIGEDNYRFFVWFVWVHASMCAYAAVIVARLLLGSVRNATSSGLSASVSTVCATSPGLVVFGGLLVLVAAVLYGFWSFHVHLILQGTTTNEYYKWKELKVRQQQQQPPIEAPQSSVVTTPQSEPYPEARPKDEESAVRTGSGTSSSTLRGRPRHMPRNAYDRGVLSNVYEVLHPRSQRHLKESKYRL
jgi:palmitoyltransferase